MAALGLLLILVRRSKRRVGPDRSKQSRPTSYTAIAAGSQANFKIQAGREDAKRMSVPRIGIQLTEKIYIPLVKSYVPAKAFQLTPYTCIVFTDCEPFDNEYQYHYILFAYTPPEPDGFSTPCFAVSSSTNNFIAKLKEQGESLPGSYTLGVFPCDGKTRHINLGLSDDWADLEKFTAKALSLAQEYLAITTPPQEVPLSPQAHKRLPFATERKSPDSKDTTT